MIYNELLKAPNAYTVPKAKVRKMKGSAHDPSKTSSSWAVERSERGVEATERRNSPNYNNWSKSLEIHQQENLFPLCLKVPHHNGFDKQMNLPRLPTGNTQAHLQPTTCALFFHHDCTVTTQRQKPTMIHSSHAHVIKGSLSWASLDISFAKYNFWVMLCFYF